MPPHRAVQLRTRREVGYEQDGSERDFKVDCVARYARIQSLPRTIWTEQAVWRATASDTLPSRKRPIPLRP